MGFPGEKCAAAIATDLVAFHRPPPPPFRPSEQIQVGLGVTLGTGTEVCVCVGGGIRRSVSLPLGSLKQAGLRSGVGLSFFLFPSSGWWRWWCGGRWGVSVRVCPGRISFSLLKPMPAFVSQLDLVEIPRIGLFRDLVTVIRNV